MRSSLDRKLKKNVISRQLADFQTAVADEEVFLRRVAAKDKNINQAREYYAASKMQAIVRGFLDRLVTRKAQKHQRATKLIQRVMRGKIGRVRWKIAYWRSLSVVQSDTALQELLDRSRYVREVRENGKKGYHWKEFFDPLSDSFWYYNLVTKQNTWQCPLAFQQTLVCWWEGVTGSHTHHHHSHAHHHVGEGSIVSTTTAGAGAAANGSVHTSAQHHVSLSSSVTQQLPGVVGTDNFKKIGSATSVLTAKSGFTSKTGFTASQRSVLSNSSTVMTAKKKKNTSLFGQKARKQAAAASKTSSDSESSSSSSEEEGINSSFGGQKMSKKSQKRAELRGKERQMSEVRHLRDGFESFGARPHEQPCRAVFRTVEEYHGHLRTAHQWFCVACGQKNPGLFFPKCSLCGNKYNENGIDGELVLEHAVKRVRNKVAEFVKKDVTHKEAAYYSLRDRLVEMAMDRRETLRQVQMLKEEFGMHSDEDSENEEDAPVASKVGAPLKKQPSAKSIINKRNKLNKLAGLNKAYLSRTKVSQGRLQTLKKEAIERFADQYFSDEATKRRLFAQLNAQNEQATTAAAAAGVNGNQKFPVISSASNSAKGEMIEGNKSTIVRSGSRIAVPESRLGQQSNTTGGILRHRGADQNLPNAIPASKTTSAAPSISASRKTHSPTVRFTATGKTVKAAQVSSLSSSLATGFLPQFPGSQQPNETLNGIGNAKLEEGLEEEEGVVEQREAQDEGGGWDRRQGGDSAGVLSGDGDSSVLFNPYATFSSVSRTAQEKDYEKSGGLAHERELFRDPEERGVFKHQDFNLFTSVHNTDLGTAIQLDVFNENEEEESDSDDSDGGKPMTLARSFSADGGVGAAGEVGFDATGSRMKVLVCRRYLLGKCSLTTCEMAHPGLRDSCRPIVKKKKGAEGAEGLTKPPFVYTCPAQTKYAAYCAAITARMANPEDPQGPQSPDFSATYSDNGAVIAQFSAENPVVPCEKGRNCPNYHMYIRPSTRELILSIYPIARGEKAKTFENGAKLMGNICDNAFNGYGQMVWPDGSVYLGDWKDNLRDGFGVFRNGDRSVEYVGQFKQGKRHGWGMLTNINGEIYVGEWVEGKMEGRGSLSTRYGDTFDGTFKNNLYDGIGIYTRHSHGGDKYMGHCMEGMAHGLGILSLSTGEKYKGYFERNSRHGRGACAYPNGSRYAGEWYRGAHEGFGIFLSGAGEKYVGQWSGGRKHGLGRYYFLNGDFYDGEFSKDKAKGVGVYYHANGNLYKGEWDNDRRNGKGTYVFANGSRYTGRWMDNNIHFKGRFDFSNGSFYRGSFSLNTKHGKGIYIWPNGNEYRGEFVRERLCGNGEMLYARAHRYVGEWKNNRKHGRGTFFYASGAIYEGQYENDIRHGKGKIRFAPNSYIEESYEGDWDNDIWHGHGVYRYRADEGTVYEGDWVRGVRHGVGCITYKDGSYYRGDFRNDQMWGRGIYVGGPTSLGSNVPQKNIKNNNNSSSSKADVSKDNQKERKNDKNGKKGKPKSGEKEETLSKCDPNPTENTAKTSGFGATTGTTTAPTAPQRSYLDEELKRVPVQEESVICTQYEGEWRANMRQGIGTALAPDGSIYHGEFWGNMRQGKGTLYYPDGSSYTGTFESNFIVGKGQVKILVGDKRKKDGLPKEIKLKVFGY